MKYNAIVKFIPDMGTVPNFIVEDKPTETKEEELLWHLNKMREHDNLRPLEETPYHTEFKPIIES